MPVDKEVRMRLTINVTCWEYYNEDNLMALLRLINLNELNYGNLDERVENFNAVLINIMNTLTFTKCVQKKLINKWYDHELKHLNRKKYELLYIAKRTGEWTEYNIIKKAYKKQIKMKKKQYLESKINLTGADQKLI